MASESPASVFSDEGHFDAARQYRDDPDVLAGEFKSQTLAETEYREFRGVAERLPRHAQNAADLTNEAKRRYVTEKIGQLETQISRLESMRAYLVSKVEWMDGGEIGPPPSFPTRYEMKC